MEKLTKTEENILGEAFHLEAPFEDYMIKNMSIYIELIRKAKKEYLKEFFKKFDKYSCIRDDKWYIEFKKDALGEDTE